MLIHEAFDQTLKRYGISGKSVSSLAGVSAGHISQFRNNRGGGVSHLTLEDILNAMEQLAPGSRFCFCLLLAGKNPDESSVEVLVQSMDDTQLKHLLLLIAEKLSSADTKPKTPETTEMALAS